MRPQLTGPGILRREASLLIQEGVVGRRIEVVRSRSCWAFDFLDLLVASLGLGTIGPSVPQVEIMRANLVGLHYSEAIC